MMYELPPFDKADFDKYKQSKPIVKVSLHQSLLTFFSQECDMDANMQTETKEHIISGIEKNTSADGLDVQASSMYIKQAMDRQFGPSWHCIIGQGFSFEVTRQKNSTMLLYYAGNYAILLFKC